jgi:murein DD-endopeptidase MepM/ murein hydrolase activator NlpD
MEVRFLPPERSAPSQEQSAIRGRWRPACVILKGVQLPLRLIRSTVVAVVLVSQLTFAAWLPPTLASGSVALAASPGPRLTTIQRGLERVTAGVRVRTAMWMVLVQTVHGKQDDLRHANAAMRQTPKHAPGTAATLRQLRARVRTDQRVLNRLLPGWLAIKASLHADYRAIKALLRASRRVVKATLGTSPGERPPDPWFAAWPITAHAGRTLQVCPVAGPISLTDSFGAPRPGGRFHEGNDLLAARGTPELAVQPGVVVRDPNTLGGNALILRSATGYSYYAHLSAYGRTGFVPAGAVIGYVGASGDAKGLIPHLHYEWHPGGGPAVDPFPYLQSVCP